MTVSIWVVGQIILKLQKGWLYLSCNAELLFCRKFPSKSCLDMEFKASLAKHMRRMWKGELSWPYFSSILWWSYKPHWGVVLSLPYKKYYGYEWDLVRLGRRWLKGTIYWTCTTVWGDVELSSPAGTVAALPGVREKDSPCFDRMHELPKICAGYRTGMPVS